MCGTFLRSTSSCNDNKYLIISLQKAKKKARIYIHRKKYEIIKLIEANPALTHENGTKIMISKIKNI